MTKQSITSPFTAAIIAGALLAVPDFGFGPLVGVLLGLAALSLLQRRR